MRKAAMVAIGLVVLLLVTFAHPFEGNTYGFCPLKSPLHVANDVVVAAIDIMAVWLIFSRVPVLTRTDAVFDASDAWRAEATEKGWS